MNWSIELIGRAVLKNHFVKKKKKIAKYLHSHFVVDEEQNQRAFCPDVKKSVTSCLA